MIAQTGTRAQVLATAALVDKSLGYPKPGIDIGGGAHVPPAQSITTTYETPIQHPVTLTLWAYPVDATVNAAATAPSLSTAEQSQLSTTVASAAPLDATWTPATTPIHTTVVV